MKKLKDFLKRKNIVVSRQRYLVDALSAMALGLFSSLIIGLILETLGQQMILNLGENVLGVFLVDLGNLAKSLMGPAIGVAVAWSLGSPPLVLFASVITGSAGAMFMSGGNPVAGGPAGAFVAALIGAEIGKMVSKETKLDILVTPAATLVAGMLTAMTVGPLVSRLMTWLGSVIMWSTERQPFIMGIIVSVVFGVVLTAPISSAALAIMLELSGIAAGAATAGCCAHMVGFAVISFPVNGVSGLFSQGLGTSMLQVPNITKNPWILLPPVFASAVTGPLSTLVFHMENTPAGAGMGTSGLVGQISTINAMGASSTVFISILLLHFVFPAVLSLLSDFFLRRMGKIRRDDYLLTAI